MATITVEWALWSEKPGATEDYGVLSCSNGRLRASHFKKILTRFNPGTPDTDRALPRVTISAWDIARQPHLGMAIQQESESYDGAGRKIAPTRFFVLPYASLAEQPVSYHDLYQALDRLSLPDTGTGRPLQVTVPPMDPTGIAADLERPGGAGAALATASWLAGGRRTCVTQAEQAPFDDRLRHLDAAAALLPYGYRAKLTATTWANSATQHSLRLFFARRSTDPEAVILLWQQSIGEQRGVFYSTLHQMLHDHDPAQVIALLAKETEARRFDDPGDMSAVLTKVDRRLRLRRMSRRPDSTLEQLRECLDDGFLSRDEAESCLRRLLPQAHAEDLNRVLYWLPQVAATGGLASWRSSLTEMAIRLLWQEGARLHDLLQVAGQDLGVDRFLAELIKARPPRAVRFRTLAAAAQLLVDHVLHDLPACPQTRTALAGDVPVMFALVCALVDGGEHERFDNALFWVRDMLPRELRPLVDRLTGVVKPVDGGPEREFGREEIAWLADHDTGLLLPALIIACRTGRIRLMISAFIAWIIDRGGFSPEEARLWGAELAGLPLEEEPSAQAMADVVLLTIGHRARWLMSVAPQHWGRYQQTFIRLWNHDWPDRKQMSLALADHLRQPWHGVPGRADQVLLLQEQLVLDEPSALNNALIASLSKAADLSQDSYARQWLARHGAVAEPAATRVLEPADSARAAYPAAAANPMGVVDTVNEILGFVVKLAQHNISPPEIYQRLATRFRLTDAQIAVAVVEQLPHVLRQDKSLHEAREWAETLTDHICQGLFGPEIARDFEQIYLGRILDGMNSQLHLIKRLGRNPHSDLGRRNTEKIKDLADVLHTIAGQRKKDPPGQRRPKVRLNPWKKGEESRDPQTPATPGPNPEAR